jgi:hypothetical protein
MIVNLRLWCGPYRNYLQPLDAPIASHPAKGRARTDTGDFGGDFSVEGAKTPVNERGERDVARLDVPPFAAVGRPQ